MALRDSRDMKIFHVLPHLNVNGGIKVAIQHCHLLRKASVPCFVTAPQVDQTPFPEYEHARYLPWAEALQQVGPDDIVIFNWPEDIGRFSGRRAQRQIRAKRRIYFAQACFFDAAEDDSADDILDAFQQREALNPEIELWSVSHEVRSFFLYAYQRDSPVISNWIDPRSFYADAEQQVAGRVGLIRHGDYYSESLMSRLAAAGFEPHLIAGSERQVADALRSCEYFASCARGVFNGYRYVHSFQLPTAEAMACGCITACYDTHGCRDYLLDGVNGVLVQEHQEADLVAALVEVRRQGHGPRLAAAARETIRHRFSAQQLQERLLYLLR